MSYSDHQTDELTITGGQGEEIGYIISYWFVWRNIHPETSCFPHLIHNRESDMDYRNMLRENLKDV